LNFDRDRPRAVLPTVGGCIKGQHLNVLTWGYRNGVVGLHDRANMKAAHVHWSLLTVLRHCWHGRTTASKLAVYTCSKAVSRGAPPAIQCVGGGHVQR